MRRALPDWHFERKESELAAESRLVFTGNSAGSNPRLWSDDGALGKNPLGRVTLIGE
jgi:hypothetical protein